MRESISRLRMMVRDAEGERWKLSPEDRAGIADALESHSLLLEACERIQRCLDGEYGQPKGEPPNPLAVMADRSIAEKAVRDSIAKARGES